MDTKHSAQSYGLLCKNIVIALLSISTSILALANYLQHANPKDVIPSDYRRTYANVLKPLDLRSAYVSSNASIADIHWNEFDPDRGWIALPHSYARRHDMTPGLYLPNEPEKGLFILDAYHQMHCLMAVRSAMYAMHRGEETSSPEIHWRHCLDFLRQSILCRADDTPLSTKKMDGSMRMCRSWAKMDEWAAEHESCWKKDHSVWIKKKSCS